MATHPFRDTEERIATGGLAARLLRNADPPADPNGGNRPRLPAASSEEASGEPTEWLGRWAVLAMFALTTSLAGVLLVLWLAGAPATSPPAVEEAAAVRSAPAAATPPPTPASRLTGEHSVGAPLAVPGLGAGGDPDPAPRPSSGPTEPPQPLPAPVTPPLKRPIETTGLTPSPGEIRALLSRGEALLSAGEIAAARPLLERAALAGDATAALRLGQSYDPGHRAGAGPRQAAGNLGLAIFWYRRSQELGNGTAAFLARKLETAARAEWGPISARPPGWRP
jgi:hypothetical protein